MSTRRSSVPPRILVADDHEWIRRVLVEVARQTLPAADLIEVEDGARAGEVYQQGGCDFLVSNHQMPHLDGTGLVRRVRKHDPGLPIRMVSVKPQAEADAVAAGANWFLTKVDIMEKMPGLLLRHGLPTRGS